MLFICVGRLLSTLEWMTILVFCISNITSRFVRVRILGAIGHHTWFLPSNIGILVFQGMSIIVRILLWYSSLWLAVVVTFVLAIVFFVKLFTLRAVGHVIKHQTTLRVLFQFFGMVLVIIILFVIILFVRVNRPIRFVFIVRVSTHDGNHRL